MVHHHHHHLRGNHWRKGQALEEDEESQTLVVMDCGSSGYYKRTRPKLVSLLLLSLLSCVFVLAPHLFGSSSTFSLLYSPQDESEELSSDLNVIAPSVSSESNGTISCDRSAFRYDFCIMKGDVRTHSGSSSVFVYGSRYRISSIVEGDEEEKAGELQHEKVKPYTRKWETSVMDTIEEIDLISRKASAKKDHPCDVYHDVPAVFFSTGGYTGNVYHEFNDGILPLFITSQHLKKEVVFVISEYHNWWVMKYGDVLSHLSDYPPIDFKGDLRTHCFPEAIVGLRIHGDLTVDPSLMEGNKSIVDFRNVLDRAYWPRIKGLIEDEEREALENLSHSPQSETLLKIKQRVSKHLLQKPRLLILSRNGSRSITNQDLLVNMAEKMGFQVEILSPDRTTELAKIYRALNSSDVMIGVHGAAMTHFLFMRPGTVFIQVIPLGTVWAAETYYGEPARKLGLEYIDYKILPRESSLYDQYDENDPVLKNPSSVTKKGWQYTKSIYLDGQNVRLDLTRFRKHLVHAYKYTVSSARKSKPHHQSQ
ncbi:Glycosyltransferase [Parasponia andersonii]|uniref:Glycosyltransferase n=1 Tax=Parasponia andersonii TaxID=3476 RepID=A0A2P5BYQ5_PARAD|nr:Glycosyltransferase [Parasponia andersonii]